MITQKNMTDDILWAIDDQILNFEIAIIKSDTIKEKEKWKSVIFGLRLAKLKVLDTSLALYDELLKQP